MPFNDDDERREYMRKRRQAQKEERERLLRDNMRMRDQMRDINKVPGPPIDQTLTKLFLLFDSDIEAEAHNALNIFRRRLKQLNITTRDIKLTKVP